MTEKSKAQEEMGLDYDPYKKEKEPQFSINELMAQQDKINRRLDGEEVEDDEEVVEDDEEETIEPEKMTVAELKEALDEVGVEYGSDDKKADLVKLYSDYLADAQ